LEVDDMSGIELRNKRQQIGIPGYILCRKAGIGRSRLSDIERGYVQPSQGEIDKINRALEELTRAKKQLEATAAECGWPVSAL
jgi:predicted transcriptional regulator